MLADVFEKNEKKNKTTSEYRLKKIVVKMAMTKDKKVELDRTHTQGKGCERLFYCVRVDPKGRRVRGRPRTVEEERTKARWRGWEVAKAVARDRKC